MEAWVFDVDGVLTDPQKKQITQPELLHHLYRLLQNGDIVALNTGRSFVWVYERILTPFSEIVQDKTLFDQVFVVCEKGNVLATHTEKGWQKKLLDNPLPERLQQEIKKLVQEEFSESMFFDESKETMISIEMKDECNHASYSKDQSVLLKQVSSILISDRYMNLSLRADPSNISLDIQYEDAGKHLGAERIEDWMIEHQLQPTRLYMLGDSDSDSEMAEELQDTYEIVFVFVGDKTKLNSEKLSCKIVFPKKPFVQGTLEFLSQQLR